MWKSLASTALHSARRNGNSLPMRMAKAALGVILAMALARCALVTNLSTAGYGLADSGSEGGGGSCDAGDGACGGFYVGVTSAANCSDGGVCCLVVNSLSSFSQTCQEAPCANGLLPIQACATDIECGSASCIKQTCVIASVPITFSSC